MEILTIIEVLEEMIEKSFGLPFSNKCIVDRDEILEIIKDIRLKLPDDIKQAKWIKDERQKILLEAQREADNTLINAENRIAALVDEHEITKRAYEQAEDIRGSAQKTAREVRLGTVEYADSVLKKVQNVLTDVLEVIKTNRDELK